MNVEKVHEIKYLAQDFMKPPKVLKKNSDEVLIFDYETEDGTYDFSGITFQNVIASRHIKESQIKRYMIKAYNSVAIVKNSLWLGSKGYTENGLKHYLIYFDGFGVFEFIAESFVEEVDKVVLEEVRGKKE